MIEGIRARNYLHGLYVIDVLIRGKPKTLSQDERAAVLRYAEEHRAVRRIVRLPL